MTQPPTVPRQAGGGRRAAAAAVHVGLLVLGFAVGVLGSFVHAVGPSEPVQVPLGLLWAYVLTAAVLAVGRLAAGGRSGAAAVSVGWVGALLLLSAPRPEGDLVVTGSLVGYAWLLGGLVVCAVAVGWPTAAAAPGR
jgi:hypothetical protein